MSDEGAPEVYTLALRRSNATLRHTKVSVCGIIFLVLHRLAASLSRDVIDKDDLLIVVSSTYGDGEMPHSAQPFFDRLEAVTPDFAGSRFATFGLGDSFYETFNEGQPYPCRQAAFVRCTRDL